MPQRKTIKWDYDSVKAHHAKYKDSVLVDVTYDAETGFKNIYMAKGEDYVVENTNYIEWQTYVVPAFFSIIIAFFIFGSLVLRDNEAAQKKKDKESILNFIKDGSKKNKAKV